MSARKFAIVAVVVACSVAAADYYRKKEVSPVVIRSAPPVDPIQVPQGMTLTGAGLRPGDPVRYLVDGSFLERPDTAATPTVNFLAGSQAVVLREMFIGRERWVAMAEGWVPAPLVDRVPEPIAATLPPGGEGLALGRTLPWDYTPSDLVVIPASLVSAGAGGRAIRLRKRSRRLGSRAISPGRNFSATGWPSFRSSAR